MKTDSRLSAYCHGNADFPNIIMGAMLANPCHPYAFHTNHKGAIAPLYLGMARVGQHRSHNYIRVSVAIGTQSGTWYTYIIRIPSFTSIGSCISELHVHLYPYHNVWP